MKDEQIVKAARAELERNAYNTTEILKLIEVYNRLGDIDSKRQAQRHLQRVSVLTATQWKTWLDEEIKANGSNLEPIKALAQEAARATGRTEFWLCYLNLDNKATELAAWEEAELDCRGDLLEGHQYWIARSKASPPGDDSSRLCQLALALPYVHYAELEKALIPSKVYKGTAPMDEIVFSVKRAVFELNKAGNSWGAYCNFLDWLTNLELDKQDIKMIQRSLLRHALSQPIIINEQSAWLRYLEIEPKAWPTAVKACKDSLNLRVWSLFILEESKVPFENFKDAFEQQLLPGYDPTSVDDLVQLHLYYCTSIRRQLWGNGDHQEDARNIFQDMIESLESQNLDTHHCVARFWMSLEYYSGDLSIARTLRDSLLPKELFQWLELASLEIAVGEYHEARRLYQSASKVVSPEEQDRLFAEYKKFEMVYGSLDSCKEYQKFFMNFEQVSSSSSNQPTTPFTSVKPTLKRPRVEKDFKEDISEEFNPDLTIFLGNISFQAQEFQLWKFLDDLIGGCERVVFIRDKAGKSRGLAHAVFSNVDNVSKALTQDRVLFLGRPLFISAYQPVPRAERQRVIFPTERDPRVLFVSHLPIDIEVKELEGFFSEGLFSTRLVISKDGHFKGCAYLEFKSEEAAAKYLSNDGKEIRGSLIRVQISDPQLARAKAASLKMTPRTVMTRPPRPRLTPSTMSPPSTGLAEALPSPQDNDQFRNLFLGN